MSVNITTHALLGASRKTGTQCINTVFTQMTHLRDYHADADYCVTRRKLFVERSTQILGFWRHSFQFLFGIYIYEEVGLGVFVALTLFTL